jgi:hypothetical protein
MMDPFLLRELSEYEVKDVEERNSEGVYALAVPPLCVVIAGGQGPPLLDHALL